MWPGIAGLFALAVSTASMLALHRARPDLDMVETPLSFYAHGPFAWLLDASLIASGIAVLLIALSIAARPAPKMGIAALAVAGLGIVLAAIFTADPWYPWERNLTAIGWIHAAVVGAAVVAFPTGALRVSSDKRLASNDPLTRRILMILAVSFIAVLILFGGMTMVYLGLGRSPGFLGLAERLLMTLAVAWLVVAAPVPKRLVGGGADRR